MFSKPRPPARAFIAVPVIVALSFATVGAVNRGEEFHAENRLAVAAVQENIGETFAHKTDLLTIADSIDAEVTAAAGKVLDEKILREAKARAESFRTVAAQLHDAGVAAEAVIDASTLNGLAWSWDYETALGALGAVDFGSELAAAHALMDGLTRNAEVIDDAVEAWEVEQARIAAKAARQASIDAETARNAAVQASAGADTSSASTGEYSVYVRTTATASSAQATINAGGQVAVDYGDGSGIFVSAHNNVDSTALVLKVGDVVTFSGAISGNYVVTGSKNVNKYGSTTADVASLNAAMKMQTCYFGTDLMRVVGMARR